jgi:hypothetical protein
MFFQTISLLLALVATIVSAHGYVDNVTVGGTLYEVLPSRSQWNKQTNKDQGYQPYTDPYTSPIPSRIIRPVQGNGPVTDLTLIDLQCGGYTAGGISGSSPANLTAGPVAAGSEVSLRWTLWPESHSGPVITYMARCVNDDCKTYLPGTEYVASPPFHYEDLRADNVQCRLVQDC